VEHNGERISPMQLMMALSLWDRPMYGYEVLKDLRERFHGVWEPKTGSIYPALKRLEGHGIVAVDQVDGTDSYSLTEEGRSWARDAVLSSPGDTGLLARYLEQLDEASARMASDARPRRSYARTFEGARPEDAERLAKLKEARKRTLERLERIDAAIAKLEGSS